MYEDRLGTAAQYITFIKVYISILHKAGKVCQCFAQRKLCSNFAVNYFIFPRERDIEFDFFLYKLQGENNFKKITPLVTGQPHF